MRFIQWSRQRRIAYPWHICAACNDNSISWGDDLRRVKLTHGPSEQIPQNVAFAIAALGALVGRGSAATLEAARVLAERIAGSLGLDGQHASHLD